ncbi:MAG: hypothetical protein IPQ13_13760 [Holophagaceae bacterium]|nr:hypothetical protein [Holophagaceae bacterium]
MIRYLRDYYSCFYWIYCRQISGAEPSGFGIGHFKAEGATQVLTALIFFPSIFRIGKFNIISPHYETLYLITMFIISFVIVHSLITPRASCLARGKSIISKMTTQQSWLYMLLPPSILLVIQLNAVALFPA